MNRLIVNADDFGFTAGISRGILEADPRVRGRLDELGIELIGWREL